MSKVEDLKNLEQGVANIKDELQNLQNNVNLSEDEKKSEVDKISQKIDAQKQAIQSKIDSLKDKTDDKSKETKEKAESILKDLDDLSSLKLSILKRGTETQSSNNPDNAPEAKQNTPEAPAEEKGFFGKTKDWVGEQWNDVTSREKRKEEPGKNIARAVGFGVTGVAIYKGIKGLWNWAFGKKKDEKESKKEGKDEKESKKEGKDGFWEKPLGKTIRGVGSVLAVGSVGYYVAHGIYTKNRGLNDLWDRERGKKLGFDAALNYSKSIGNNKDKKHMAYGMELNYDESTQEIIAYGERVKINKNARKIEGLEVNFNKYEDMICAAILIAYLKKEYAGKCDVAAPFSLGNTWSGNINIEGKTAVNGTGTGWRTSLTAAGGIAGIAAGIFSGSVPVGLTSTLGLGTAGYIGGQQLDQNNVMHNFMPELDNEYGKKSLISYLDSLNCWKTRMQTVDDVAVSPIKAEVEECMKDLQESEKELVSRGSRRQLDAIQDPNNPSRYTIKAYKRNFSAEVSGEGDNRKIKLLGIDGGNPVIKMNPNNTKVSESFFNLEMPLKEGIYLSSFLGYLLEDGNNCIRKGNKEPFFYYGKRFGLSKPGIYFNDPSWDTYILTEENFRGRMPTVFNNKDLLLNFLNEGIVSTDFESIWRDPKSLKK